MGITRRGFGLGFGGRLACGLVAAVVIVGVSDVSRAEDASAKQLTAFSWSVYHREVGRRDDGLSVFLNLPEDRKLLGQLRSIDKSRPLRVGLAGKVTDQDLRWLATVTNLTSLVIDGGTLTAEGLEPLSRLPVQTLTLSGTRLDGQVLQTLSAWKKLRHLELVQVVHPEPDLASFAQMSHLEHLSLDVQLRDDDFRHLGELKQLRTLILPHAAVTDEGLQHLGGLSNLRSLMILDPKVTAHGLRHLRPLNNLASLHLTGTVIPEHGMDHLRQLPQLRFLVADVDKRLVQLHLPRVAMERMEAKLDQETILEMVQVPLEDVIDYLADAHDLAFDLDDSALPHREVPFSIRARGISLRTGFELMQRAAPVECLVQRERVVLVSREVASRRLETRLYDLDPLLVVPDIDTTTELVSTIRSVVYPKSWKDPDTSLQVAGKQLRINQSQRVHEAVELFLDELGPRERNSPQQERIRKTLDEKGNLGSRALSLEDFATRVRDRHGIQVVLDPAVFNWMQTQTVMLETSEREQTLKAQLEEALKPLDLSARLFRETVLITSRLQVEQMLDLHVYHVADLVERGESAEQLAAWIRSRLPFDQQETWRCEVCLNRLVILAPAPTHAKADELLRDRRR